MKTSKTGTNERRHRALLAWITPALAVALGMAACGDKSTNTSKSDTKKVTLAIKSEPRANVNIDGRDFGETPVEVALKPGDRTLRLEAPGFKIVEEALSVSGPQEIIHHLVIESSDDESAYERLAAMLDVPVEKFEAIADAGTHRGSNSKEAWVQLYWPAGDVTEGGLETFRLDLLDADPEAFYDEDDEEVPGKLFFKKGKRVLYERDVVPSANSSGVERVVANIPADVLAQVKANDTITWGVAFEGRRYKKKSVEQKIKVVKNDRADKAIKKLLKRKSFQKQPELLRELYIAETLLNKRLYTQSLTHYIGITQRWPQATQPYKGMVNALRRMKLTKTEVFKELSSVLGGKGGHVNKKGGGGGLGGASSGTSLGGGTSAGEKTANVKGNDILTGPAYNSVSNNPMPGAGRGVTDAVGVGGTPQPTDASGSTDGERATQDPTPVDGRDVDPATVSARDMEKAAEEAREQVREAIRVAETMAAAEDKAEQADQAVQDATKAYEEANAKVERLTEGAKQMGGNMSPEERQKVEEELRKAGAERDAAQQAVEDAVRKLSQINDQADATGGEAQTAARELAEGSEALGTMTPEQAAETIAKFAESATGNADTVRTYREYKQAAREAEVAAGAATANALAAETAAREAASAYENLSADATDADRQQAAAALEEAANKAAQAKSDAEAARDKADQLRNATKAADDKLKSALETLERQGEQVDQRIKNIIRSLAGGK